jgi:hypothetical protein
MWEAFDEELFFAESELVLDKVAASSNDPSTACECLLFLSHLLTTESAKASSNQQHTQHQERLLLSSQPSTDVTLSKDSLSATSTLSSNLTRSTDRAELLLDVVERALDAGIFQTILKSPKLSAGVEIETTVSILDPARISQALMSLPDKCANLSLSSKKHLRDCFTPSVYYLQLREALLDSIIASIKVDQEDKNLLAATRNEVNHEKDDLIEQVSLTTDTYSDRRCALIEALCAQGHSASLGSEWVRSSYNYTGAGGCFAAVETYTSQEEIKYGSEWPSFKKEFARCENSGRAGRLFAQSIPEHHIASFAISILLAATGIAMDFVSCTPAAGRMAHPIETEINVGPLLAGILFAAIGKPENVHQSNIHQYLQQDVFFSGIPLPGYVSRALLFYLLCPALSTKRIESKRNTSQSRNKNDDGSDDYYSPLLSRTHGYIACDPSIFDLSFWLSRIPLIDIVNRWTTYGSAFSSSSSSSSSSSLSLRSSLSPLPTRSHDASLSRVILHLVFLCPQTAFDIDKTLLPLLLKGVQSRIDSPNDIDRRIAMRIAHAFSHRTQDQMLKRSADVAGKAADHDEDRQKIVNDFAELGDEGGGDVELDVSAKEALDRLRRSPQGPLGAFIDRFAFAEIESPSLGKSATKNETSSIIPSTSLPPSLPPSSLTSPLDKSADISNNTNQLKSVSNVTHVESESVKQARLVFAAKCPQSLSSAYNRLMSYIKDDGGGGGNAMPIAGGASLDEDAQAVSGTPDGAVALFSTLERLIRTAAEDDQGSGQSLLIELAVPMLNALFTSSNRYELRDLPLWRFASMVALVSCAAPLSCAHIMLRLTLSHDSTEVSKLEALDVLVAAARELSPSLHESIGQEKDDKRTHKHMKDMTPINFLVAPLPPWERKNWLPDIVDDINNIDTTVANTSSKVSQNKTGNLVDECDEDRLKAVKDAEYRAKITHRGGNLFANVAAQHFFFPLLHVLTVPASGKNSANKSNNQDKLVDEDLGKVPGISTSTSFSTHSSHVHSSMLSLALDGENKSSVLFGSNGSGSIKSDKNKGDDDENPNGRSFELLTSQIVRGLAVFLELSGDGEDSIKMARALLPLAWLAKNGGVLLRRSSLSSFAAVIACCYRCGERLLFTSSVLDSTIAATRRASISSGSTDALQVLATVSQRVAMQMSVENLNKLALRSGLSGRVAEAEDGDNSSSTSVFQDDLLMVVQWMKTVEQGDSDEQCRILSRVMLHNPILSEVLRGSTGM